MMEWKKCINITLSFSEEIQFGVMSTTDIAKLSVVELVNRGLYNEHREGIAYGPLDLRMVNIMFPLKFREWVKKEKLV